MARTGGDRERETGPATGAIPLSLTEPAQPSRAPSGAVPPWMMFWIASTLVLTVPGQLSGWWDVLLDLLGIRSPPAVGHGDSVLRLVDVADLVPALLVFTALAAVCAAPLRGRLIQWQYGLSDTSRSAVFGDITEHVHGYAPGGEVRRTTRPGRLAFVYPCGFRRAGLAVCPGLIVLWNTDREAATAVIHHELSHCRQGDQLILGTLSPFGAVLRRMVWIIVVFIVIPVSISWVAETTDFLRAVGPAGVSHKVSQLATEVRGLALLAVAEIAYVLAAVTMPIAASWSAELAADHEAGAVRSASLRALAGRVREGTPGWLRSRIIHPPTALRRGLLAAGRSTRTLTAVAVYPAAWLVQLLWLLVAASAAYLQQGMRFPEFLPTQWDNVQIWAHSRWPIWTAALVVVLVWPAAGRLWRRVFAPAARPR